MTGSTFDPAEPVEPSAADTVVARESARRLVGALAKANGMVRLRVEEPDGTGQPITVPPAAFRLLLTILSEMASGNAVRVIPQHDELTTGKAAELLNVSRPYAVRLLDEGKIPSYRVGTHRRVLFKDVMAYREEHYRARSAVLDEMAAIDQELGLT
jgi:excisionase family DNA binding protein